MQLLSNDWAGWLGYIIFNKSINQLNSLVFFIIYHLKFKLSLFFLWKWCDCLIFLYENLTLIIISMLSWFSTKLIIYTKWLNIGNIDTHMYVHIWPNTPQLMTVQCLPLLLTKSLSLRALSNIFDSGDALATLLLDLFQSLRRRREEINARSWPTATSIRPTPRAPGVRGRRGRGWALSFGQLYRCWPTPRTTPCVSR